MINFYLLNFQGRRRRFSGVPQYVLLHSQLASQWSKLRVPYIKPAWRACSRSPEERSAFSSFMYEVSGAKTPKKTMKFQMRRLKYWFWAIRKWGWERVHRSSVDRRSPTQLRRSPGWWTVIRCRPLVLRKSSNRLFIFASWKSCTNHLKLLMLCFFERDVGSFWVCSREKRYHVSDARLCVSVESVIQRGGRAAKCGRWPSGNCHLHRREHWRIRVKGVCHSYSGCVQTKSGHYNKKWLKHILVVPPSRPKITVDVDGPHDSHHVIARQEGEDLNLTCTTKGGNPKPHVAWYMGHEKVRRKNQIS